jgi:T4-like virus tail tube protein gp19
MAFNVNDFIQNGLQYGGARPSLFEVVLYPPTAVGLTQSSVQKLSFMCQGANLPPSTMSSIDIPYFGRKIKVAGERTFQDWQLTILNDEDFKVRSLFEKWSNALNSLESNLRTQGLDAENYKADMDVIQYAKDGNVIRSYTVIGGFPTDVSAIDLNWNTTGSVETFTASIAYDYWIPNDETGVYGGDNSYAGAI